jgi:Xaa-Pro aminopeptidase
MRPLEKGDMIIVEMHPKFGGYYTHVERTFCLGEPEPRYLDIYDACLHAYRASASARPASTVTASPRSNTRATATM